MTAIRMQGLWLSCSRESKPVDPQILSLLFLSMTHPVLKSRVSVTCVTIMLPEVNQTMHSREVQHGMVTGSYPCDLIACKSNCVLVF